MKFFILSCAAVFFLGFTSPVSAATQMANLENALMCKCDDKCGKVMINCTCDTSKKTRADFQLKLASGLTVDQVVQIYVDKYGETVLSAPSKSGFNLTAWITPFAALLVGGVGVRKVIRSWVQTGTTGSDQPQAGSESMPQSGKSDSDSNRLKDELDRLET